MTQYIAIIINIIFIFYVFKIDLKRKSNFSYALWIPLIWMMYSAARPLSFWFSSTPSTTINESAYMEGNPFDRNILSILIFISLFILFKRKKELHAIYKNNPVIFLWFLFCGISILWSDFPLISFRRWIKAIGLFLSVLIVHTEVEPISAVKILIKRFAYILISISILLIIYFPAIGVDYYSDTGALNYRGVTDDKNGLAVVCAISGIFFIYNLITMRQLKKLPNDKKDIFIQVLFLIITIFLFSILNSATSLAALTISMIIFILLGFNIMKRNLKRLEIIIVIAFITGLILQSSFDMIGTFTKLRGRDLTFTGRTLIWQNLLSLQTNPWIGAGYGGFWIGKRLINIWEMVGYEIAQSHNGYISIYLDLGWAGIFLLICVILFTFRNIKQTLMYNFEYGRFLMVLFVFTLIHNYTESSFGLNSLIWFVFLNISVNIPNKTQIYNNKKIILANITPDGK
jgi:exopolysaccharide production protein ExoQ